MKFVKMHGLGNDFVIIEEDQLQKGPWINWVPKVCDRHFGVGADGVVLISHSTIADVKMCIINADGKEAEQCGNAVRCVAKYVYEDWAIRRDEIKIETRAGVIEVRLSVDGDEVTEICVNMGEPTLITPSNQSIVVEDQVFHFTSVSMGNPHAIIEVADLERFPVERYGRMIEIHPMFPQQTNVEFACFQSLKEIQVRVWERGVGETLACGTGACAVVVAGVLREKCDREASVILPGGKLDIYWSEQNNQVYMTGPAVRSFYGKLS